MDKFCPRKNLNFELQFRLPLSRAPENRKTRSVFDIPQPDFRGSSVKKIWNSAAVHILFEIFCSNAVHAVRHQGSSIVMLMVIDLGEGKLSVRQQTEIVCDFSRERLRRVPFKNLLWYSFPYHHQHLIISSSHHLIISSSHHRIIASSHHRIISSSHHLIISSSHHLIISSSHHLIISSCHHLNISSSHHLIISSSSSLSLSFFLFLSLLPLSLSLFFLFFFQRTAVAVETVPVPSTRFACQEDLLFVAP